MIIEKPSPFALSEKIIAIRNAKDVKIKVNATPTKSINKKSEISATVIPFITKAIKVPEKNPTANGIEFPKYKPINNELLFMGWQSAILIKSIEL